MNNCPVGLFDASDPDVEGIDDVVGLCSGKFATQAGSDGDISALFTQPFPAKDNVDSANLDQIPCIESQDTVILTGQYTYLHFSIVLTIRGCIMVHRRSFPCPTCKN